jgi:23S rRNA pseudouridine2605 synthase
MERNGMNGAKVGRGGKLSGGRQRPSSNQAYPSDPYGTGLSFSGGLANGHPGGSAGGGRSKGGGRGKKPAGPGRAPRAESAAGSSDTRRRGPGARAGAAAGPRPPRGDANKPKATAAPEKGNRGSGKPSGGRSRPTGTPRGDDWQPRSASAHESHLGKVGGRGR